MTDALAALLLELRSLTDVRAIGLADRIEAEVAAQDSEIAKLRAEVREWLCQKCRTVYPGPPKKGFDCVICPKCSGDCAPRGFTERTLDRAAIRKVAEEIGCRSGDIRAPMRTARGRWATELRRIAGGEKP